MSERDDLRDRCIDVAWDAHRPWVAMPEGQSMARVVDAVLAEIERDHVIVPRAEWQECEDCYPEVTRAAGKPLPDGVTSVTWGWGPTPSSRSATDS